MVYVMDTHVLIWYFIGSKRLKRELKEKIEGIRNEGGRLLVPTIVLAEALAIAEKGKVEFDFQNMYQLITSIVASIYPADKKDFRFLNSSSLSNSNRRTLSLSHGISRFD